MRSLSMTSHKKQDRIRNGIRMGIFDKKNKGKRTQDFDSPVEKIELKAKPTPAPKETAEAEEPKVAIKDEPEPTVVVKDETEPSSQTPEKQNANVNEQHYGIEEAIALIRTLPTENVELVTRVVKQTLESTHIDIPTIILDATTKEECINSLITNLKAEIAEREAEIAERKKEIAAQESDLTETEMVKQRLEHAVALSSTTETKKKSKASTK